MIRRPPRSTRTDTLRPYTTLFRSLITGAGDPLIGRLLMYDALDASTTTLKIRRDPDCPICSREPGSISDDEMGVRSEEHTSELQSLMRISYAVFCLKKKKYPKEATNTPNTHYH